MFPIRVSNGKTMKDNTRFAQSVGKEDSSFNVQIFYI